jgi:hypothetical protein
MKRILAVLVLLVTLLAPSCGNVTLYAVTVVLTNFQDRIGQNMTVWVREQPSNRITARQTVVISNANFAVTVRDALQPGLTYNIDFWIDVNGNGLCDPPPLDHSWSKPTGLITNKDVVVSQDGDKDFNTVCTTPTPASGSGG